uniref:TRAF-type domain-containing protein n=1 Tax=Chromera velia CCMP2878 TaxID=1169474 RepID=A0A0G4IBJ5_9ALVE|eukprot:Cvel_2211.t1-p1 / transcript=Cvel_2211.t1 / gene=Cvel_2211 / organism=Chromera_velia_CCMP2878 / gene_product=TNF receptor-associated factor family protein, putative / transcript_product=TNF receptor-associated factor family protein, putative / location=Cvel_scaffold85:76052-77836(+) / protein_length=339 / sequence_SO=supercontig / SO=protein_coding / is_pseudo=false
MKQANRTLREVVESVTVKCKHHKEGCEERVEAKDLDRHLQESCQMAETGCSFQGCDVRVKRCELSEHKRECPYRVTPSGYCSVPILHIERGEHNRICQKMPLKCPACGTRVQRTNFQEHCEKCPKATVSCFIPGCGAKMKRKELGAHQQAEVAQHGALFAQYEKEVQREKPNDVLEVRVNFHEFLKRAGSLDLGRSLKSGYFHFQGSRFFVQLYPNGNTEASEGKASVELCGDSHYNGVLSVSIAVETAGVKLNEQTAEGIDFGLASNKAWGHSNFCDVTELMSAAQRTAEGILQLCLRISSVCSGKCQVLVNGYGPVRSGGRASAPPWRPAGPPGQPF